MGKKNNNHLKAIDVNYRELDNNVVLIISLRLLLNCKWKNSHVTIWKYPDALGFECVTDFICENIMLNFSQ